MKLRLIIHWIVRFVASLIIISMNIKIIWEFQNVILAVNAMEQDFVHQKEPVKECHDQFQNMLVRITTVQ